MFEVSANAEMQGKHIALPVDEPIALGCAPRIEAARVACGVCDVRIENSVMHEMTNEQNPTLTSETINYVSNKLAKSHLSAFFVIVNKIAENFVVQSEGACGMGRGVPRILIVSNETFQNIRSDLPPPPDWAGVYVYFEGTVVIRAEYIRAVLSGLAFAGETVSFDSFVKEMGHEFRHSYEDTLFFKGNISLHKNAYTHSLWFFEGLKEAMDTTGFGMKDEEFQTKLRDFLTQHPHFSFTDIGDSFWSFDSNRVDQNLMYQYSKRLVSMIAPLFDKVVDTHTAGDPSFFSIHHCIERYCDEYDGKPEPYPNFLDYISARYGITTEDIRSIELELQASVRGVTAQ